MTVLEIRKTGVGSTTLYLLDGGLTQRDFWDGKTVKTTYPPREEVIAEIKTFLEDILKGEKK